MLTSQDIDRWAEIVAKAKQHAFEAGENRIIAETMHEIERANAYREGRIEGSNPETRKASERTVLLNSFERLRQFVEVERKAKHELDLAELQWERIRMQLRLIEALTVHTAMPTVSALIAQDEEHHRAIPT